LRDNPVSDSPARPSKGPTGGTATSRTAISSTGISALQAALAAEQAACYGYGVAGAYLTGSAGAAASTDWIAHEVARDKLTELISAAGATPGPAGVAYQLPFPVASAGEARSLAVVLEDRVAQAYLALVGLTDPALRALGAAEVRAAALRGSAWRGSPVAFPGLPAGSLHSEGLAAGG
jgi:hypothetical protein